MQAICLIQFIFLTSLAENNVKCPAFCKCTKLKAVCKGKEATYIPRFPLQVTSVTMLRSKLLSLDENSLLNLTLSPNMKEFNLTDNGITKIHPNAFSNVVGIKQLTVQHERKLNSGMLMTALAKINDSSLKTLFLTNNKWYGLPKDMFSQFLTISIENLHLTGNRLHNINCSIFAPLRKLRTLFLTWNFIETIDLVGLNNLRDLTLSYNHLLRIPQFCSSNKSKTPRLKFLKLSHNFIFDINSSSFQCIRSLTRLELDAINLVRIEKNTFANLHHLKGLNIGTACFSLIIIENCAFNSSSLESLILGANFNFHGKSYDPNDIFAHSPNLKLLDLSQNNLKSVEDRLRSMLRPLKKLETLIISNAQLMQMPQNVFTELSTLKSLIMDRNEIDSWNNTENIFGNNPITYLSLRKNLITVLNKTSFSNTMWKTLSRLDLSLNPFSCTCDQMWFRNWINNGSTKLNGYPKLYRCESPNNMKKVLLKDYRPTIESCTPWNPLFTMIVIVSSASAFVLVVIGIVCQCQTNIKNRIYLFRVQLNKRKGYHQLENTVDFEYHAFVVYCEADSKWVHNEFLRRVEYEEGLKLCVHHRDFDVGEAITNNIDRYLQKSLKVVVVLSNNFAKSDWCQWEIDVVQERRRRQGKNAFLLIMLKNIDSKHMTSSLRTLLESTPHLTYQTGIGGKLFWKAAVETLRRPLGHPPTAVL